MCKNGIYAGHQASVDRDGDSPSHPRIGGDVRNYKPGCCKTPKEQLQEDKKAYRSRMIQQGLSDYEKKKKKKTKKEKLKLEKERRLKEQHKYRHRL